MLNPMQRLGLPSYTCLPFDRQTGCTEYDGLCGGELFQGTCSIHSLIAASAYEEGVHWTGVPRGSTYACPGHGPCGHSACFTKNVAPARSNQEAAISNAPRRRAFRTREKKVNFGIMHMRETIVRQLLLRKLCLKCVRGTSRESSSPSWTSFHSDARPRGLELSFGV